MTDWQTFFRLLDDGDAPADFMSERPLNQPHIDRGLFQDEVGSRSAARHDDRGARGRRAAVLVTNNQRHFRRIAAPLTLANCLA